MDVKVKDDGACRKTMSIVAPYEALRSEYEDVLRAYCREARMPGFRKGRAPKEVVEKKYCKAIGEDVQERTVPRFYKDALEKVKIEPVAIVGVSDVSFDKESGIAFDVTVDVAPKFKVPKYTKIALKGSKTEVEDRQVDEAIERLRGHLARYEDVTGRPVQHGDLLMIDFKGEVDGKPIKEVAPDAQSVAEGTDFWMLCGDPEFIPGLPPALEGASVGEERNARITFPKDFNTAQLAGITAHYHVSVKAIRERVLPEIDEKFLKQCEAESEQALRDRIKSEMTERMEADEKGRLKGEIIKYLLSKTDFELPRELVRRETGFIAEDIVRRNAMAGATKQQIEANSEKIVEAASSTSEERLKAFYVLEAIAEKENIKVEESELDLRIESMAEQNNTEKARLLAQLEKNGNLGRIKDEMLADKTLDYLLEHAKVKI